MYGKLSGTNSYSCQLVGIFFFSVFYLTHSQRFVADWPLCDPPAVAICRICASERRTEKASAGAGSPRNGCIQRTACGRTRTMKDGDDCGHTSLMATEPSKLKHCQPNASWCERCGQLLNELPARSFAFLMFTLQPFGFQPQY